MTLFSELYNSYYQIVYDLITKKQPLSQETIAETIQKKGYEESMLYLIPKLAEDGWQFFHKENGTYTSRLSSQLTLPLSTLQKSWLKALLLDRRIQLFLSDEQLQQLSMQLSDVDALFAPQDFYYYDAFTDGDDYNDEIYRQHFRTLMHAIEKREYLNISYQSRLSNRIHYWFLPCKLEYSIKNDCFRLLALEQRNRSQYKLFTLNVSRITEIIPLGKYATHTPNINRYIKRAYYKEPVTLLIKNERNTLERAMLQFANYEKNTVKCGEDLYQCEIYYNKSNETELLIEVLSFGPTIKVLGNENFLKQLKERLAAQKALLSLL